MDRSSWVASKHPHRNTNQTFPSRTTTDSDPIRSGTSALLGNAILSLLTVTFIPSLLPSHNRKTTLPILWSLSLLAFAFLMTCTYFVEDMETAVLIVAGVGIPWAVTNWVPFTLISECLDGGNNVSRGTSRRRGMGRRLEDPCSYSWLENEGDHGDEDVIQVEDEEDVLVAGGECESNSSTGGGAVLGIHNIFIVVPQLLATLLTSLVFFLYGGEGGGGNDAYGACLRIGIGASVVAAVLALRLAKV
ncbi:UNVERIFIED_CONTAM: hypothetical protein HDU68_002910 [Siphonaria sp. JEL0065]|nr:hypothetical protein HDU68_002910 [Siphonaria sp. JEL0065]